MAFTEHKLMAFKKKLADLPDQPNLSAAELKAYFDSSPEELRQAHNALCTDAARLDDRVSGIVAETFGDSIPKTMLAEELQSELDGKAEETSVFAHLAAECAVRQDADTALTTRIDLQQTLLAQKCEAYVGSYTGDGAQQRTISLGFTPKAVLVIPENGQFTYNDKYHYGGLAFAGHPARHVDGEYSGTICEIVSNGFIVCRIGISFSQNSIWSNAENVVFHYIALK